MEHVQFPKCNTAHKYGGESLKTGYKFSPQTIKLDQTVPDLVV